MLDAVLPVLGQTGVQDPVLLHVVDLVLEVTRIRHRDLLIPPGRSRRLLPFEGIELGDVDGKRRQFHTERRVAHVLRDVERRVDRHADAGESRVETHGRGTCRLRPRGGVIHRSEVVGVVGRRGVVHAGIERAVGIGLRILRVVPRQLEVRRQQVVGHVLLAPDGVLVADEEVTAETVALLIVRCGGHAPRALCIDLTQQLQVHLVADSEIIAAVAQIEALIRLVAVGRHDQSAGVALREGEEAVRHSQRQRHVGHNEVRRSEHHVLARPDLRPRHRQIEVRMRIVAGRIAAVLDIHLPVSTALRQFTGQEAVVLSGIDILDQALLRLEVERHRTRLILVTAHLEHR